MTRSFVWILGVLATCVLLGGVPATAASAPFQDPHALGHLTFCDVQGQPVTHGSITARPFVWRAVSSLPAPAGASTLKAALLAYQPRQGADPGVWSGMQLTGSSTFTSRAHPTAAATYGDSALVSFTQAYPPLWDGLVQLRMHLTGPVGATTSDYAAATVRVSGSSWSVVDGAAASCAGGQATPSEISLLPAEHLDSPRASVAPPAGVSRVSAAAPAIAARAREAARARGVTKLAARTVLTPSSVTAPPSAIRMRSRSGGGAGMAGLLLSGLGLLTVGAAAAWFMWTGKAARIFHAGP